MKGKQDATAHDPPTAETPFERFAAFARRIVSVPKAEIEEQERLYREKKTPKRDIKPASR